MTSAPTDILTKTIEDQLRASDPRASAWVSANAGSGKTYVLAQRVVRLLLSGVPPSKILCLTFTKAAAAEMSNRVFEQLGKWCTMDDEALIEALSKVGEYNPSKSKLHRARLLFTRALESPGGLKIQTIHAFCEALLHQFTLEANTSGHFEVMGDADQKSLMQIARQFVMTATLVEPNLASALNDAMQFSTDQAIEKGLEAVIRDRHNFEKWIGQYGDDIDRAGAELASHLGVNINIGEDELLAELLENLPIEEKMFLHIGEISGGLSQSTAITLSKTILEYKQAFTTKELFEIRSSIYTLKNSNNMRKGIPGVKPLYNAIPGSEELLEEEKECFRQALNHYNNWKLVVGSVALFKLADAVIQKYSALKRARGFLDFDDLVNRSAILLARSDVRHWVQYKLDNGIDHVLVDEAQDTNSSQWQIINAIIEEFFAGKSTERSGHNHNQTRTVFAVGDQKQSIYSFQGAQPELFSQQKTILGKKARDANLQFQDVELQISFRSTLDVLSAVDKVFENDQNARGLHANSEAIIHQPNRQSDPGEVQIWPMIDRPKTPPQEDWLEPIDHVGEEHPAIQLSKRVTKTIGKWIREENELPGKGRKITCGDILILVRKRDQFVTSITRELKHAGLSVAGADRINLVTHIAVEDLLSLAKWALYPEDDLALAEILKCPLFDLSETQLADLCVGRSGTLWQSLREQSENQDLAQLSNIFHELKHLKTIASIHAPYEFFNEVISTNQGRKKFRARLGGEVDDVLDALLLEALNHTNSGGAGLQAFIHSLEVASPEIKRELDLVKDEIRVMTVHSAKGLEAPIVFLVDPGSPAYGGNHRPAIIKIDKIQPYPAFLWQPLKDDGSEQTKIFYDEIQDKAEQEYRRLLYVGMTRAEDKLIVCGYGTPSKNAIPTWLHMVKDSLIDNCEEIIEDDEITAWRWMVKDHPTRKPADPKNRADTTDNPAQNTLPPWISKNPPREGSFTPPLSPSIASQAVETKSREQDFAEGKNRPEHNNYALQRGNATHQLLQFLPNIDQEKRADRTQNYLKRTYSDWTTDQISETSKIVLAILEDVNFMPLFSTNSIAEVSLTGTLDKNGLNRQINGQIDRLCVFGDRVLIIDYKTDRNYPQNPEKVSDQYLIQMAIYQQLVADIYPNKSVECSLLWTSGPYIMSIPQDLLNNRLELWLSKA